MFNSIKGKITDIDTNRIVLECSDFGFDVFVSTNTIASLKLNDIAKIHIYEAISENSYDLYGFLRKEEKKCFELLLSVSGIGPKAALSILSYNTPEQLFLSIISEDIKSLSAAPGIGKKTAQRVIVDLKDKVNKDFASSDFSSSGNLTPAVSSVRNKAFYSEAVSALNVLGYSTAEIMTIISRNDVSGLTTEEIVKLVLKQMV